MQGSRLSIGENKHHASYIKPDAMILPDLGRTLWRYHLRFFRAISYLLCIQLPQRVSGALLEGS